MKHDPVTLTDATQRAMDAGQKVEWPFLADIGSADVHDLRDGSVCWVCPLPINLPSVPIAEDMANIQKFCEHLMLRCAMTKAEADRLNKQYWDEQ
jgi:hypothetical protein